MKKIRMNKTIRNIKDDNGKSMISYRYGRNKENIVVEILKVDYDLYKKYRIEDYGMQLEMMYNSEEYTDLERDETLASMLKFKDTCDRYKDSYIINEIKYDLEYYLNKDMDFEFKCENHLYFNINGDRFGGLEDF